MGLERIAFALVTQLPEDRDRALEVLAIAEKLVRDYFRAPRRQPRLAAVPGSEASVSSINRTSP